MRSRILRLLFFERVLMEISKKDWKLFQERLPDWQEKYMEKLEEEYVKLLQDPKKLPSEKFWALKKRINADRKNPGVSLRLEKSETFYNILYLLQLGAITMKDLDGFSEELINKVEEQRNSKFY